MRLLITNLLATAMVLFGAASASAFALNVTSDYNGTDVLAPGSLVNVQITFDADALGVQALAFGVVFDNAVLQYNPQPNAAVGVPSYYLYSAADMMAGLPGVSLYAQQDPWQLNPGPPPGFGQVSVNWATSPLFEPTRTTGLGLLVAGLQFEVIDAGDGAGDIDVRLDVAGGLFRVNDDTATPIAINGTPIDVITPEPSTALLVGLGLVGLGVAGRRRQA